MIQSLAFPLSRYRYLQHESWDELEAVLKAQGLDGLEILGDEKRLWEPLPPSMVRGYQMRAPLDWLDCYLGDRNEYICDIDIFCGEAEDAFKKGTREDITAAYREDLKLGLSINPPYIVFDVSNADEQEVYTQRWSHSDYWVMDAAIELLNGLLDGIDPTFVLLLGNNRWPGLTFLDPKKTEYLLSRINYPKVGIMLDTARLLSTKHRTKNQGEALQYIHSILDRHGELCKSILGLHFSYVPTSEWSGTYRKVPDRTVSGPFNANYSAPDKTLRYRVSRLEVHTCWTRPECISLIDRLEPRYLVHMFYHNGWLTRMGALTRQLKAISKGRELQAQGESLVV